MDMDEIWSATLDVLRELGPVEVRRSQFAPKPAVWMHDREIVHWEGPGAIDVRITVAGWTDVRGAFGDDPAVLHEPGRRDWVSLRPASPADVERLRPLLEAVVAANG